MIYIVRSKEDCDKIRSVGLPHIGIVNGYEYYTIDNKDVSVSFILVDRRVV